MKKALMVTTVASTIDQFLMPSIFLLKELGYEVDVACNFLKGSTCNDEKINDLKKRFEENKIQYFQIDASRSLSHLSQNIKALKQLKNLIKQRNYQIMHCHTPIGGVLARLAAKKYRKNGLKVFYTAHGFHFFKGALLKNWLCYYPVEKLCSRWTDTLITMNQEDFNLAKRKMKAKTIEYIPGVGIDVDKFKNVVIDKDKKRAELGIPKDAFMILSVGELNENKNHISVIRAISKIDNKEDIWYAIAGRGHLYTLLKEEAQKLGVNLLLLGFRTDVAEIYKTADLFIHPSFREGLPVSVMEAMASGLEVIGSDIRGNKDLLPEANLFIPNNVSQISTMITKKRKTSFVSQPENLLPFSLKKVNERMRAIYAN